MKNKILIVIISLLSIGGIVSGDTELDCGIKDGSAITCTIVNRGRSFIRSRFGHNLVDAAVKAINKGSTNNIRSLEYSGATTSTKIKLDFYVLNRVKLATIIQGLGSGSASDPHFMTLSDPDPDPHKKCGSGSGSDL